MPITLNGVELRYKNIIDTYLLNATFISFYAIHDMSMNIFFKNKQN